MTFVIDGPIGAADRTSYAPLEGCHCNVCNWANRIIERQQRLDADLEANYQKYAGELVSKDETD